MSDRWKAQIFSASLVAGALLLYLLSGSLWARSGEHLALPGNAPPAEGGIRTLPLSTRSGAARERIPVPGAVFARILPGDVVRVSSRRIPVLNEELAGCELVREGLVVESWSEGAGYYATALALAAFAAAAAATGAAALVAAVIRLQPLGTED